MTALKEQDDAKQIKHLIQRFFDSINAADTKALQTHFLPSADLTITRQDPPRAPDIAAAEDGGPDSKITVLIRTTIERFIKMIEDGERRRRGKPGPKLHEAPDLDATEVRVDALFGTAWSPFRVTFDGKLHHYGVMVFRVGKTSTVDGKHPGDKVTLYHSWAELFM